MNRLVLRNTIARVVLLLALITSASALLMVALFGAEVRNLFVDRMYEPASVPEAVYGVVLGAQVEGENSEPGVFLRDRLDVAIELLRARRIMGVIITGDDGAWRSNEIKGMLDYLHAHDVPDDIIYVSGGAYRTFDSCKQLRDKGFTNVVLITQRFHLPRALYLCNKIGVTADGAIADRQWYPQLTYHWTRDFLAAPFAYFDVRGVSFISKGPQ